MEVKEPTIEAGSPPHCLVRRKTKLLLRSIVRATLFLLIFVLSFHLPPIRFESMNREQMIEEIRAVLERHPTGLASVTKEELAEVIYEEAIRHNQDPKFILAIIAIESEFKTWAVSVKGAKGLMQIMPEVGQFLAQEMGIEWSGDRTLFNPFLNIRMGVYYLSQLMRHFNDPRIALTAYNYGPTYVQELIERNQALPPGYYRRILSFDQNL